MELIPYCNNCRVRTRVGVITSRCVKIVCPECLAFVIAESSVKNKPANIISHSSDARFVLFLEG